MGDTRKRKISESKPKAPKILDNEDGPQNLRYGPMPTFPNQRKYVRHIVILSTLVIVYLYSNNERERILASTNMKLPHRTMSRPCSESFTKEVSKFHNCIPKSCGRGVYDNVISQSEADTLSRLAEGGFSLSKPAGGAAILDLHSGALSQGENFVDIYQLPEAKSLFSVQDFQIYKIVRTKIQHTIAGQFMVDAANIHLTHPTFFSRLTALPPKTVHDEYWHSHVDKETYETFHYTALLYLSEYKKDFEGGRFLFIEEDNSTTVVEPTKGRVLIFTSGAENAHRVERVTKGVRTAITIAFTCNQAFAAKDPHIVSP